MQNAEDRNRRSIYVFAKRNMRLPLFEAFDQPDMHNSCPRRTNTTTAPQALELLNGELTDQAARRWSGKLLTRLRRRRSEAGPRGVYRSVRPAAARRRNQARPKNSSTPKRKRSPHDTAKLDEQHLPTPLPAKIDRAKAAAVLDFCHAMLCSNEFLYVD